MDFLDLGAPGYGSPLLWELESTDPLDGPQAFPLLRGWTGSAGLNDPITAWDRGSRSFANSCNASECLPATLRPGKTDREGGRGKLFD